VKTLTTSFERFEYKYWVSEEKAAEFLSFAESFMREDEWAPGRQRVTSLYLDSPELDFMQLHVQSSPDRSKLRVRAYGDPLVGPAFFEIKRKVKRVTFKQRAIVPLSSVSGILRGQLDPATQVKTLEEQKTLEHFLYLMLTHRAEPQAYVTCRREAFTATHPSEQVRITFDRQICYQPARELSLNFNPKAWTNVCGLGSYLPEAPTLIEIKFRGVAPFWIERLVERLELEVAAYSKYVMAMTYEDEAARGDGELDLERAMALAEGR
jgi:hypothetical protein